VLCCAVQGPRATVDSAYPPGATLQAISAEEGDPSMRFQKAFSVAPQQTAMLKLRLVSSGLILSACVPHTDLVRLTVRYHPTTHCRSQPPTCTASRHVSCEDYVMTMTARCVPVCVPLQVSAHEAAIVVLLHPEGARTPADAEALKAAAGLWETLCQRFRVQP
jgi:hypothetical protein